VRKTRDEEDDETIAALHRSGDVPSERRPKRVQRYVDGERTTYFKDEDESLESLVEAERRGNATSGQIDANLASAISRSKRFKGMDADAEYDHDDGLEMSESKGARQSEAKRQRQAAATAGMERKQQQTAAERAEARFDRHRQLIIAMGNHVYLRLQDTSPLGDAHCVIEPMGVVTCLTEAPEEVADEVRNFQKCLIRMLEARGQEAIFIEQHTTPPRLLANAAGLGGFGGGGRSMALECVPLTARDAKVAPGYFRKAILEAGEEWSQHRKLYETSCNVRGTIPPGFSYFASTFGVHAGYATVIEDETSWPADFGRDVLEGILEHEDAGIPLARRRKEPFERMQQRVVSVTKAFEPFDWTKQL
jgi:hypothetical protein